MKRILTILSILLAGAVAFGWMRTREQTLAVATKDLEAQRVQWQSRFAVAEVEQGVLRDALAAAKPVARAAGRSMDPFSPRLAEWLAAGNYSTVPADLVSELRTALGLAEDTNADYVLISKPTMQTLRPPGPRQKDKLSDGLCGLLSIAPEQRTQIETAMAGARKEFADWAKQNVVRDTPRGDEVLRYTLPAANDFADALTNRLLSAISDSIGTQRSSLFRTYAETWFQIEMGYLGGVTNTLAVLKRPDENGQEALFYKLTREREGSSMSEGPGKINPGRFPPAWRNVFPGGWAEVAEREGFELPKETPN